MYLFELEFCPDGFHVLDLPFSHFPVASWRTESFQVIAFRCVCAPLLSCVLLFSTSGHGISQARILEWVAISAWATEWSSWARVRTWVFCTGRWLLYHWVPREALHFIKSVKVRAMLRGFESTCHIKPGMGQIMSLNEVHEGIKIKILINECICQWEAIKCAQIHSYL